ncbi:hypothetical protein GCM10027021_25980 [Dyella kyungheensis]
MTVPIKRWKYWLSLCALACLIATLSGCVGPTPYQKWAKNGGYDEFKVDVDTYNVVFYGNRQTTQDMVWYYWMYRCAELTHETGYEAFTLVKLQTGRPTGSYPWQPQGVQPYKPFYQQPPGASNTPPSGHSPTAYDGDEGGRLIPVHAGGTVVVHTMYIPGGTVTMTEWSAHGIVTMYHVPLPENVKSALNAKAILDMLGPYVMSHGKSPAPSRMEVLKRASVGQQAASI